MKMQQEEAGTKASQLEALVNCQSAWLFSSTTEEILALLGNLPRRADLLPSLMHSPVVEEKCEVSYMKVPLRVSV